MLIALWMSVAGAADILPLKRVRFYEVGVAWYERRGTVDDAASLVLPASHVDDALKTMMVLGGDAGVGAITFPTRTDTAATQQVAGLSDVSLSYDRSLRALVGEEVIIRHGGKTIEGTLLDLSQDLQRTAPSEEDPAVYLTPEYAMAVLTKGGELLRLRTTDVDSVRAWDPVVLERVRAAAHTLSPTHPLRASALQVQAWKGGEVRLGYLSEAPVWRVTYRLTLPPDATHEQGELQGWSLVHNDTSEDWDDVVVELSNGKPDSFLYPLVAPRYEERILKTPERYLSTTPQLATTTADEEWGPHGSVGLGSSGTGYGSGAGSYGAKGVGHMAVSSLAPQLRTATPLQTPTQFIYQVDHRLDLPARHSALVPILQSDIAARTATVLTPNSTEPRHGAWLQNNTQRTLPGGPIAVTAFEGLSGEAEIDRLEPDATQMIWFGKELDVDVTRGLIQVDRSPSDLEWDGTKLRFTENEEHRHRLRVRNRGGRPRTIGTALSLLADSSVVSGQEEHIDRQQGWTWVVLPVEVGDSDHEIVTTTSSIYKDVPGDVPTHTWNTWLEAELGPPEVLNRAAALRRRIDNLITEDDSVAREFEDNTVLLASLRADLAATDGSNGTIVRRIAATEGALKRGRERRTAIAEQRLQLERQMAEALEPLRTTDSAP